MSSSVIPPRSADAEPFLSPLEVRKSHHYCSACSTSARSRSHSSSKSSYWRAWSNAEKLGSFLFMKRGGDSDLTEESLEAHNRRQEVSDYVHQHHLHHHFNLNNDVDNKNAKCSPYYKGLIDARLTINREKLHPVPAIGSPGRESHSMTTASSSSSLASFIMKMQGWGSNCFLVSFKSTTSGARNDSRKGNSSAAVSASTSIATIKVNHPNSSPSSSLSPSSAMINFVEKESDGEQKLLRERVLDPKESLPTSIPSLSLTSKSTDGSGVDITAQNNQEKMEENVEVVMIGREFVWADKYRPKSLDDFICNRDKVIELQDLMKGDCKHFIFEGPAGVGKRTMIWAMLQETFSPDRIKSKEEYYKAFNFKQEQIGKVKARVKESSQHVELNLCDVKGYERHVIVELIKETQSRALKKSLKSKLENCRAIILYEADKIPNDALLYIKWLLEKYKDCCKFFFCCSDVSKLLPIKSLCTFVKLLPPSNEEIVQVLEFIAAQEGIELTREFAERIAANSKNNLRQAIRSFEACWTKSYPFSNDQIIWTGWEDDIAIIAKNMVQEQSPKQLYIIRGKLQNLIEHDVSLDYIFESLVAELKKHLEQTCQVHIDRLYKHYNGTNPNMLENEKFLDPVKKKVDRLMRIEEFIARFMSFYKCAMINKSSIADREGASQSTPGYYN